MERRLLKSSFERQAWTNSSIFIFPSPLSSFQATESISSWTFSLVSSSNKVSMSVIILLSSSLLIKLSLLRGLLFLNSKDFFYLLSSKTENILVRISFGEVSWAMWSIICTNVSLMIKLSWIWNYSKMSHYQKFIKVNNSVIVCIINLEDMFLQLSSISFRQNLEKINCVVQWLVNYTKPLPS